MVVSAVLGLVLGVAGFDDDRAKAIRDAIAAKRAKINANPDSPEAKKAREAEAAMKARGEEMARKAGVAPKPKAEAKGKGPGPDRPPVTQSDLQAAVDAKNAEWLKDQAKMDEAKRLAAANAQAAALQQQRQMADATTRFNNSTQLYKSKLRSKNPSNWKQLYRDHLLMHYDLATKEGTALGAAKQGTVNRMFKEEFGKDVVQYRAAEAKRVSR